VVNGLSTAPNQNFISPSTKGAGRSEIQLLQLIKG